MSIAFHYFWVALFAAVFSLFRFGVSLGLLERPLVVGFVWALVTGEWTTSMSIAIFFELAWLDLIPAGTFIPPHLTAAAIAALALVGSFSMTTPGEILVAIVCTIPLAWLGTRFEARVRVFNSRAYNTCREWVKSDDASPFPDWLILRSLLLAFGLGLAGFYVCLLGLHFLVSMVLPHLGSVLTSLEVTWPHLWVGASLGGLLALRLRRAYAVFASGLALIMIITLLPLL